MNCQGADFEMFPVHIMGPGDRERSIKKIMKEKEKYSCVLSIRLSSEFGVISSDLIANNFKPIPVYTISNLYFSGLHPDATYIGGMNQRAPGPIGDYHSRIALLGFLMSLGVEETSRLYCDTIYKHFQYYQSFADSLDEMRRRDMEVDIPIGDLLERSVRMGQAFLSQNHPSSFIIAPYANRIAGWLQKNGFAKKIGDLEHSELVNYLAFSSIFPVYPEIATHHKLPYEGNYIFKDKVEGDIPRRVFDLPEFIEKEFHAFQQADRRLLTESYPGNFLLDKYAGDDLVKSIAKVPAVTNPPGSKKRDSESAIMQSDPSPALTQEGVPFGNDTRKLLGKYDGLDLSVGKYTYGFPQIHYAPGHHQSKLDIGAFCSIAGEVEIFVGMGAKHGIDMMTSFPITMVFQKDVPDGDSSNLGERDLTVTIGSDVLIGQRSLIMNGVKIGHGAVIAPGSVVDRDVAPYEVVAGNPVQHVEFRFAPEIIERLLNLKWWEWSDQKIKANLSLFFRKDMGRAIDALERA